MRVNREELIKAARQAHPGVANKGSIDQSDCFVIAGGTLTSFNDEISIVSDEVSGLDGDEIECAVKADPLLSLLKQLDEDYVEIDQEEKSLVIESADVRTKLSIESKIRMPVDEISSSEVEEEIPDQSEFIDALKSCLQSTAKTMTYPVIACVHLNFDDGIIESTDNYRATRYELNKGDGFQSGGRYLLPASTVKQLVNYDIASIHLPEKGGAWVHFSTPTGCVFSARVYKRDDFPDLDDIFDAEGEPFDFSDVPISALDTAAIFADQGEITVKADGGSTITIASASTLGRHQQRVDTDKDLPGKVEFRTNVKILKEVFKRTRTAELDEHRLIFSHGPWRHVIALPAD